MIHELLLSNIAKHISLEKEEIAYFVALLTPRQLKKKDFILEEGQVCRHINFINAGLLRAYHLTKDGRETTIMFAMQDWWITDMYCFINELPAMLNIVAVENSFILQLEKSQLDKLYLAVPRFERFFRIIMQNAYIREQLRVIQNLSLPAEERYFNFLEKYPQVARQVTLKQIATYLGITPEFLSMIRAKQVKK